MRHPSRLIVAGGVLGGAIGLSVWAGARRQQTAVAAHIDTLRQAAATRQHEASAIPEETLPAPVARYLRLALRTGARVREVRIAQVGTLRTDLHSNRWMRFQAEHVVVPPATGFVWNARVAIAPLLHVRVRDALVEGRGSGHVALLSAFTIAEDAGTPEMNSGSLHRYLAEAVWYPEALRPSAHLRWSAIDDRRALATLTDHDVTVSLEFRFAETGEVTGIYTPGRWGTFDDGYRQVPWEGHFGGYEDREGLLVPTEGDVGWYVDGQWRAVWRGRVTALTVRRDRGGWGDG